MDRNEDPDAPLVVRAQGGDDDAFAELVGRYGKPLTNFAYRLLGDATEGEDVAQDALVRAYRALPRLSLRKGVHFSTWLFQIARNVCLDRIRYRKRHPREPLAEGHSDRPSGAPGPSEETAARETAEAVARAVAALPENQRTALVLSAYHEMSQTEIAAVMRCSIKSLESRLYRARQELRKRLARFL